MHKSTSFRKVRLFGLELPSHEGRSHREQGLARTVSSTRPSPRHSRARATEGVSRSLALQSLSRAHAGSRADGIRLLARFVLSLAGER